MKKLYCRRKERAAEYVEGLGTRFLGYLVGYQMFDPPKEGREVFSLMRQSDLDSKDYLDRFFDTGFERASSDKSFERTS